MNLCFWVSDPVELLLKRVQFGWEFEIVVFLQIAVDILKIVSELESPKNDFSRINYDFSKLQVCCRNFCTQQYCLFLSVSFSSFLRPIFLESTSTWKVGISILQMKSVLLFLEFVRRIYVITKLALCIRISAA